MRVLAADRPSWPSRPPNTIPQVSQQLRRGSDLRLCFISAFALAALFFATGARSALAADAYVANYGSDDVSVIDTQSDEVVGAPIAVGSEPEAIAISPDAKTAYVVNFGSDDVSVIDLQTNEVVGSPIEVGAEPVAIAISPDGKRAYVVNSGSEDITVIDTQTNQVVGSISLGKRPWGIAITPDGKRAYVAVDGPKAVAVIDTETNQVIGSPIGVGMTPIPIAITPDGKRAYVANYEENDVSVIDTQSDEVSGTPIKVGIEPWGIAITPDGKTAYVANEQEESVSVIDTQTNEVVGSPIKVGSEPYVVTISPDGKRAYVPNFGTDTVSVIDTQTNQVLGSPIKVGNAPAAIAIPPDQAPVASFTAPVGRAGAPLSFDASASSYPEGSVPGYDWEFGDGTKEEDGGPSPSHTYSAPGVYEATLTLSDSVCSSEEIFTGQTAYCAGAGSGRFMRSVRVGYPGVRVKCPRSAKHGGCRFKLQAVTKRLQGKAESAMARARLKAGRLAVVSLKPKPAYKTKLAAARKVLVKETVRTRGVKRTTFSKLKFVR